MPATAEIQARDSVLVVLEAVDMAPFLSSFDLLSDYAYQRYIRTEQFDEEDFVLAFDEFQLRTEGTGSARRTQIDRADSAGSFDFGFFNRFVSENVESVDPVDLVPFVLPDELGYDNPRNVDRYEFGFLPDSLMWDRLAQVIEIRARPELADGLNIRKIRYYIDTSTSELIGVYLERIDLGLLFREESTFYVDVRRTSEEEYLPNNTRFESMIKTPFRTGYRIRTVSTFTDFERSSAP